MAAASNYWRPCSFPASQTVTDIISKHSYNTPIAIGSLVGHVSVCSRTYWVLQGKVGPARVFYVVARRAEDCVRHSHVLFCIHTMCPLQARLAPFCSRSSSLTTLFGTRSRRDMNGKSTELLSFPQTQSNIVGPRLDDVQRYCVLERAGALKALEGSMHAPAGLQTEDHTNKDGGRHMHLSGYQAGEYRQASEMDAKPMRQKCAHEDQKLLCDLVCAFRACVRDSGDHKGLWLSANAGTNNTTRTATLHTPYKAAQSCTLQESPRVVYPDCTTRTKLLMPTSRKMTSLAGVRCHNTLLGRSASVSNNADLTWQLRKMFSKEVRRKQRKTSVLPKVVEAPMESIMS